jgi:hypothetical protein
MNSIRAQVKKPMVTPMTRTNTKANNQKIALVTGSNIGFLRLFQFL